MDEMLREQIRERDERYRKLRQRIEHNEKAKQRRARLKAEGRCTRCGSVDPVDGKTLCKSCAEDQKKATQRLREKKLARGECMFCSSPAEPGQVLCRKCADKNNARILRRKAERKNV